MNLEHPRLHPSFSHFNFHDSSTQCQSPVYTRDTPRPSWSSSTFPQRSIMHIFIASVNISSQTSCTNGPTYRFTGTTHIQDKTHTTYVLPTKLPSSISGRHKCPLSRTTCHTRLLLTERATPTFGHGLANRSRQSRLFQSKSLKSMPKSRWLRIRYGARSVHA